MNERDRVLQVMQSEGMNAKQFCKEVGISQGTLSNIMGGRNKPSLDVMQAILRRFRAVSCDWLIMGIGSMYIAGTHEEGMLRLFDTDKSGDNESNGLDGGCVESPSQSMNVNGSVSVAAPLQQVVSVPVGSVQRSVAKILVFYSDGTFEER